MSTGSPLRTYVIPQGVTSIPAPPSPIVPHRNGYASLTASGTHLYSDSRPPHVHSHGHADPAQPYRSGYKRQKPTDPADPTDPDGKGYFQETKHNVGPVFLAFWNANGGVAQFGYPITELFDENGASVQYFERARFELRNGGVELGRLGVELTQGHFFRPIPFFPSTDTNAFFGATGHSVGGPFLDFWRAHGTRSPSRLPAKRRASRTMGANTSGSSVVASNGTPICLRTSASSWATSAQKYSKHVAGYHRE